MNKSENRHMNVFQAYSQNGLLPIENNISRGLAILLQEKPGLLMLLLNEIIKKKKNDTAVSLPTGEYTVDFQRSVKSFEYYSTVIGVALTSEDIILSEETAVAEDRKYITDISVFYDDTLIIIEVKRTSENCENQLREQLNSYKSQYNSDDYDPIGDVVVSINWTEIIEMLTSFIKMSENSSDRLTADYYEHLKCHFPNWFPVRRLDSISAESRYNEQITNRLERVKELYVSSFDEDLVGRGRTAIPLRENFVTECDLAFDESRKSVKILLHPSDTCWQFWNLKSRYNYEKDLLSTNIQYIIINGCSISVEVNPYIKFSHFSRGQMWLEFNKTYDVRDLFRFAKSIVGRKKADKWDDLWGTIKSKSEYYTPDDLTKAIKEFDEKFKGKKTYADVSLGFDVIGYVSFADAQKIDSSDENIVSFLKDYISTVIKYIAK